VKRHVFYYFFLVLILVLGFLIAAASPDKQFQAMTITITSLFYILWGIVHHHIHHDLTAKIVVEYTLMAGLGGAVIFFILKGGFNL